MAAASSVPVQKNKLYDVFISFRGENTRNTFTCHLYDAFLRKKIKAYIDEESLKKGDEISPALMKAIQESKISVVILSENYATSSWCLEELGNILHCKETDKQIVIPVFYNVEPSNVRHQKNSYATAFTAHEKRFCDKMDKVQKWKNALTTVSDLSGFHLSSATGSDSKLVEAIVKDVMGKLNCLSPSNNLKEKDLIGMDKRIEQFESLLNNGSQEVRIVGIWGIGGIGKTTLARAFFDRFASQFERSFFLENVKEELKRSELTNLQKQLFSKLLGEESSIEVNEFANNRLQRTKALVVLDNVDSAGQLEYLVEQVSFGPGSKIIITTRDSQVLNNIADHEIYPVEGLNLEEALQLFCSKAFRRNSPPEDYESLSCRVVEYTRGLPLALKVLGSHLHSKRPESWESALNKLKKCPIKEIHEVLKISYDGLDRNEKEMFLDIACFFNGGDKELIKRILHALDRDVEIGIQILTDKSLITLEENRLRTHDLLQEMGWEIVREESYNEPGKRSRLWLAKDIYRVLKYNTGTKEVQGISLNIHELESDIDLDPLIFKDMINLKYLSITSTRSYQNVEYFDHLTKTLNLPQGLLEYFDDPTQTLNLPQGLLSFPDELRYVCWNRYPSRTLPPNFKPQNLVELNLQGSKLEKLWDGVQNFGSLKVLHLEESKDLIEIPNLSQALNVDKICLNGCRKLEYLPEISEPMPNLRFLNLSRTGIIDLPKSIYNLIGIEHLDLMYCQNLKSLPTTFCKLKSLKKIILYHCSKLKCFPEISEPMPNLEVVDLDGSGIRKLPTSLLENPTGIDAFSLRGCKNLKLIPPSIYNKIRLDISGCPKLKSLPHPLSSGANLVQHLRLIGQSMPQIPNNLFSCLTFLSSLKLSGTNIRRIPENIKFSKLCKLDISHCSFLQSLPELPLTIEKVDASDCTSLKMVSNLLTALTQPPIDRVNLGVTFSFKNCLKLEHQNLMFEFQMRASLIATEFALRKTLFKSCPTTKMCYPGDNIPEWFSYQEEGSSINIPLPCNSSFMGFAFCFILSYNRWPQQLLPLDDEIYVETFDGYGRHFSLSLQLLPWNAKNHVFMTTCMDRVGTFYSAGKMSFNFRTNEESFVKIKRCGIRLLHVQDAMEFGIISSQYVCRKSNVVNDEGGPSLFWESILEQLRHFQVSLSRKKLCEKIWSSNLNHRYKILWWQLLRDALPVRAALNHACDTRCPLCGSGMESAIHLFLFCKRVRLLWFMSQWRIRTDSLLCDSMASFLEIVLDRGYNREFLVYASLLVDTIWEARNKLVYDGKVFHVAEIHSSVQAQFNQISTSKRKRKWRSLTLRKSCFLNPRKFRKLMNVYKYGRLYVSRTS